MYLEGKHIKKDALEAREYQSRIAGTCLQGSTLVVLPTGLGKTVVALIVVARTLEATDDDAGGSGGKVLILAPTKPLVEQHKGFFERNLEGVPVAGFTGELSPDERDGVWMTSRVIVSTPQVIQNDLLTGRYDLSHVALIIFDEAHRARGNYSYVHVSEMYRKQRAAAGKDPLTMGTTASPGSTPQAIGDVCSNLGLVRTEVRTEEDQDVKPYVHDIDARWRVVDLPPEQKEVAKALRAVRGRMVSELQAAGFIERSVNVHTKAILTARELIQDSIERCRRLGQASGSGPSEELSCLIHMSMVQAQLMTVGHAVELAETQGPEALRAFLNRLHDEDSPETWSRSAEELLADPEMQEVLRLAAGVQGHHPKVDRVREVLDDQLGRKPESRVIVFSHYRDTAEVLIRELMAMDGVRACRFVGQADRGDDKGLTQREQKEILDKFREGTFNVLVATSVAEEGLDIPSTDMVVFYEPVASEIRAIQRRGRTGRARAGRVEVLLTRGTKDEAAYWASRSKERRMRSEIEQMKELTRGPAPRSRQWTSSHTAPLQGRAPTHEIPQEIQLPFAQTRPDPDIRPGASGPAAQATQGQEPISIVVDNREVPTQVALELNRSGATVNPSQLKVGDYVLSDRVAVERKATRDFLDSLVDGRLFQQLSALRSAYSRPLLVVEGEDMEADRNVHPAAIDGAMAAIVIDLGIPVLRTRDARETASLLVRIARRERTERHGIAVRKGKARGNIRSRLRMVIEGLPNVSSTLSDRLLTRFGSVKAVTEASVEALQEVRGVGPLTAVAIYRLLRAEYNPDPLPGEQVTAKTDTEEGRV